MYSSCILCSANLGANELVERFPVGRRLAFDPERGRLLIPEKVTVALNRMRNGARREV